MYKVPGGMLSNMIANLKDMNAMDKFDEASLRPVLTPYCCMA